MDKSFPYKLIRTIICAYSRTEMSENGEVDETSVKEIKEELARMKTEFSSICQEVQSIQQEQRQMALQFQTELQNLVSVLQNAHQGAMQQRQTTQGAKNEGDNSGTQPTTE